MAVAAQVGRGRVPVRAERAHDRIPARAGLREPVQEDCSHCVNTRAAVSSRLFGVRGERWESMVSQTERPDEFVEHTTEAALEEKAKLQKHFSRFDIFFFLICTLVGLDTL